VDVLCDLISGLIPRNASVLDVGCGDGRLTKAISARRPDLCVSGVDVKVRAEARIPVVLFDGCRLPFEDRRYDITLLVDVIHHADDPLALMREAVRVASVGVVVKDHICSGLLAEPRLRFMDWVGNAGHGVALPYRYWSLAQWQEAFGCLGLSVDRWLEDLRLYRGPVDWVFGGRLQFVAGASKGEGS